MADYKFNVGPSPTKQISNKRKELYLVTRLNNC